MVDFLLCLLIVLGKDSILLINEIDHINQIWTERNNISCYISLQKQGHIPFLLTVNKIKHMSQIFKSTKTMHFEAEYASNYSILVPHNSTGTGLLFKETLWFEKWRYDKKCTQSWKEPKGQMLQAIRLLLNMRTKGHEPKLENGLAQKCFQLFCNCPLWNKQPRKI